MNSKEVEDISREIKTKMLPGVTEWSSTGCTLLDIAISNRFPGGIPVGRIVHTFGGTSTCKSVLAITVCGFMQRIKKVSHYADTEHTLDSSFASIYGLNCEDEKLFKLGHPKTLEELFDEYIAKIIYDDKKKTKININPKIIAIDSITALPAEVELKEAMKDGTYGTMRAKQMSKGLRKYIFALAESNTTLFCVDQTRDNIGGYGPTEVTSGGRALEFYSSVQIYLKMDTKIVNTKGKVIGNWVKFKINKNKVAPPLREGRFRILYDYGLDDIATNLYFLNECQNGPQEAKKKTTMMEYLGQKSKMSTAINYIEDNNLEEELQKEVWEVWQEQYETEKRKHRNW